ncbi:uncharacterized protein LOC127245545 isoform X2 [Andrographis paniculata]|uniref:uncharacterized protein LOC127245545 isoform X2 n=1 Tax=Andrographis paniculata TaxID=175694 RepID=UPI0021E96F62|nr:uncharacterized protein LOC127245545 isoform X2 [Andrographis paniculata]
MLSGKRPSKANKPFVPPFARPPPEKLLKSNTGAADVVFDAPDEAVSSTASEELGDARLLQSWSPVSKMVSVLADAGCLLVNSAGTPCLPSNLYKFRQRLDGVLSGDSSLRLLFLKGFSEYISSTSNMRRVLLPCQRDGFSSVRSNESLVRLLLLVKCIQQELIEMLLEKLPEYFDTDPSVGGHGFSSTLRFEDDVARLILNQFRWLDFLVNSNNFVEKLLQVIYICPHTLKKEMIGSLPEIIGDQNNKTVVSSLQEMLQEDSSLIVPVLDAFSNLNLDDLLQDQVILIALSCIRTIDVQHMPYLLRFLLISAKPSNARLLISKIRDQLKFLGGSNTRASQLSKLKGKSVLDNTEASILDALRSGLRFKSMLCLEFLKELKSLKEARDHKAIDIWLLILISMSSEPLQKSVQMVFKKKIIEGCFHEQMFDQCIHGIRDFSKDYLAAFLSLSSSLLCCKQQRAQEFGIHMYTHLFEEFCDAYSRQEVLGALITHVGSGMSCEVSAALDAMVNLATKKSSELSSFSSHIIGILDYLEGFGVDSLHKVYDVFIRVAVSAQSSSQPYGCSIANELLMILRKQINNSDLMYKMIGVIGTLKIVSYIADTNNDTLPSLSQRSNYEEAMELLELSFNSCRQPLPLMLFYEELVSALQRVTLHPIIMAWVGKQLGEFEPVYLSDLDNGNLVGQDLSFGLEGELWMNLDGDISPICLNILPLVLPSSGSTSSLQVLPSKFLLLSVVERAANQGSLEGIDALLGCPFHLPSSKLFSEPLWQSLTAKQKQILILSLYYAANWIRELLNAFATQVFEECDAISQSTRKEVILKLIKRLRNLVFLESLLDNCLKLHQVLLPELYPHLEPSTVIDLDHMGNLEKMNQHLKGGGSVFPRKKKTNKKSLTPSSNEDIGEKLRQPTLVDIWRKAGAISSQDAHKEDLCVMSSNTTHSESAGNHVDNSCLVHDVEISALTKCLEAQKYKFRPLSLDCLSLLAVPEKNQCSCCSDPSAELPLHLYILRDLHKKLDNISPTRKQNFGRRLNVPAGCKQMKVNRFLSKMRPLLPYLRQSFERAALTLREGAEPCQEHWITHSRLAANPEIINMNIVASPTLTCISVFKESILCFGKMLTMPDLLKEKSILLDVLQAFQPIEMVENFFEGMQLIPSPGNIDYLYAGAYMFLGGVFDVVIKFSFMLASEVLLALEFLITSISTLLSMTSYENGVDTSTGFCKEIVPFLCNKLGNCARKLLMTKCNRDDCGSSLKANGEMIQKILRIYLGNFKASPDLLNELACSILSQVSSSEISSDNDNQTFPILSSATMTVWYRVLHEENISTLNNLVREIALVEKPRGGAKVENVQKLLNKLLQSVSVVVTLVNMCRNNDKVSVHAMAVKYGGKYIDCFLKGTIMHIHG